MKFKNIFSYISILFFSYNISSQIKISEFEKTDVKKEEKISIPKYNDSENFIIQSDTSFYRSYIGVQIYYPEYTDDFEKTTTLLAKNLNFEPLSWSEIGNKSYTIMNIFPSLKNMRDYEKLKKCNPDFGKWNENAPVFLLKDENKGDVFYSCTSSSSFILVPYFEKLKQIYKQKILVANNSFNISTFPNQDKTVFVDFNTQWKCIDVILIKNKSFIQYSNSKNTDEVQSFRVAYLLKRGDDMILLNHEQGYGDRFANLFQLNDEYKKEKEKQNSDITAIKNNYIKKYGKENGLLISKHKVKIGMTKKMCTESWGLNFNKKTQTDSSGVSEIYYYPYQGTLIFKNGILKKIIE